MTGPKLRSWMKTVRAGRYAPPLAKSPRRRARANLMVEALEDRRLLSTVPVGYIPSQIRHAYGIDDARYGSIVGDGAGQTIAVIDAYGDPAFVDSTSPNFASSDLGIFDSQLGIPDPPSFKKYAQDGSTNYPGVDASWTGETSLDIEWAHAIAPMANIVQVEANDASGDNLQDAIDFAKTIPGVSVISMSFGAQGENGTNAENQDYTTPAGHTGISFLYASGDDGAPGSNYYPNTIVVGATRLSLNDDNTYQGEVAWGSGTTGGGATGGGYSQDYSQFGSGEAYTNVFTRPVYQNGFDTQATRGIPDVSIEGDPDTGVAVYDSIDNTTPGSGWDDGQIGGTSLATPIWGGIIAIADQFRAADGKSSLDGATQTLPALYGISSTSVGTYGLSSYDYHDITSGNNTDTDNGNTFPGYNAGPGWDPVTGRGSPYVNLVVNDLAGVNGDLEYFAPDTGTNNLSVKLNNGYIEIYDNGALVEGKAVATTDSVIIHGADGVTNDLVLGSDFDATSVPLVFDGGNSANALQIEGAAGSDAFIIADGSVTLSGKSITFSGVQKLTADGNGGGATFTVTPSASTTLAINGGSPEGTLTYQGNGTITGTGPGAGTISQPGYPILTYTGISDAAISVGLTYLATSGGTHDIEVLLSGANVEITDNGAVVASSAASGTTSVTVVGSMGGTTTLIAEDDFNGMTIPLTFTGGSGGTNTLEVEGGTGGDTFAISGSSFVLDGKSIVFSNVQDLIADGDGGGDLFNVTAGAVPIAVNGGSPGGYLIYTGNGTIAPTGTGAGTITQGSDSPITYTGILGILGQPGDLYFIAPNSDSNEIVVTRSGGEVKILNDGFVVASATSASTTRVDIVGGAGVGNTVLSENAFATSGILLNFIGGAGGQNGLTVEGSSAADTFVSGNGSGTLDGNAFDYSDLQTLAFEGNGGADDFDITPTGTTAITVDGGGTSSTGTLTFEGTGTVDFTGPGAGTISSSGNQPVTFTGIGGAIDLTGGYNLTLTGTDGIPNTFGLVLTSGGVVATVDGVAQQAISGTVNSITIDGGNDGNTLTVDNSGGLISAADGITFNGGIGSNVLIVVGDPGSAIARGTLSLTAIGTGKLLLDTTGAAGVGGGGTPGTGSELVLFGSTQTISTVTPVTEFDYFGVGGSSFALADGGVVSGAQTQSIVETGSAAAESTDIANAATLTVNGMGGAVSFAIDNHTDADGLTDLKIYGNELTGGMLHAADTDAETFSVESTDGFATTVTGSGGSSTFAITGAGLVGQDSFLGGSGTNAFNLDAGSGLTAGSVDISGGSASSSLVVEGPTGGASLELDMAGGALGERLMGLGLGLGGAPALAFDTVQSVSVFGSASGSNNFAVVDDTGIGYAGVGPKALDLFDGILYRPTGAESGDIRTNLGYAGTPLTPSVTPAISFSNIGGSFSIAGGSSARDTLTVLGVSATGSASALYDETTAADPADQVTITDTLVTISNASLGDLRAVAFNPATISNLVFRAGNKSGTEGDTITVTASKRTNLLVDAMSARSADKVTVNSAGTPSYSRTSDPSRGGPQIIVSGSDGAFVGLLDGITVSSAHFVTVGQDTGGYQIQVYDSSNLATPKFTIEPYFSTFRGGIRVAVGDVNGDGIPDIVTVNGPGADANVEVFDGVDGHLISSFIAFTDYAGGATVAVGDVNGDGYGDIVVGSDAGVSPHVIVFSGKDGSVLDSFYAFSTNFLGGINVAAGDVEGTGKADIVVGAASGASPHVIVFRSDLSVAASYLAFDQGFLGGVTVAVLDADGSGKMDIVVGAASGTDPHLEVFDGVSQNLLASFDVPDTGTTQDTTGTLALSTLNSGDGSPGEILYGRSNGSVVRRFQIDPSVAELTPLNTFDPTLGFGVYVGGN